MLDLKVFSCNFKRIKKRKEKKRKEKKRNIKEYLLLHRAFLYMQSSPTNKTLSI